MVPVPDLPDVPFAVALTVAAAARRLGVAPATLRTWDRRYGLGPSAHRPGAHRRYTAADIARLDLMRRLVVDGVAPVDAAGLALRGPDASPAGQGTVRPPAPAAEPVGAPASEGVPEVRRSTSAARAMARAAAEFDAELLSDIAHTELSRRGVVATWDDVIVPFLRELGQRWATSGAGIEVEHLASSAVQAALTTHARGRPAPAGTRTVLLACAQDEQHGLVLSAVDAALAERAVGVHVLGAGLPRTALAAAVRRTGPAAVFLWSHAPGTGDVARTVSEVPAVRPAPLLVLGGPGWWGEPPVRAAARVRRVDDLASTVELLATAGR